MISRRGLLKGIGAALVAAKLPRPAPAEESVVTDVWEPTDEQLFTQPFQQFILSNECSELRFSTDDTIMGPPCPAMQRWRQYEGWSPWRLVEILAWQIHPDGHCTFNLRQKGTGVTFLTTFECQI